MVPTSPDTSALDSRPSRGILPFATPAPSKKRIEFIDLLRGWAVIIMIETHVLNATLRPELMLILPFKILNFINGLVAPAFLFASGLAYAITTRRKLPDYLAFGTPLFRQVGRLVFILLIGYGLHIPKFNYHHLRYETGELAWQVFFQVDVLQCIAASLLIIQLLLLVLRTERRAYRLLSWLTAGIVLSTPLIWGIDFSTFMPLPLAEYFNSQHHSLFPLFYWSAFLFAGVLTGYYYMESRDVRGESGVAAKKPAMTTLAWIALGMIGLSFVIEPLAASVYPDYDYWHTSPSFYLLRLGLVLLLLFGMYTYERTRGVSARSPVTLIGRESLLVYVAHLMIVYGNYGSGTFASKIGGSLGYPEAIGIALLLMVLMYGLALGWSSVRRARPAVKRTIELAVLAGFVIFFFVGLN